MLLQMARFHWGNLGNFGTTPLCACGWRAHFRHPSMHRRTLRSSRYFGCCKKCSEHGGVSVFLNISLSLDERSEVELLGRTVVLRVALRGASGAFTVASAPACVPTSRALGSLFSTPSVPLVLACLFGYSPSNRCEVTSHWGFDLLSPDDEWY